MLLLRKIIFYIFAAVYVVACPLVIAYALGYMFVPQQRNVIQTGLISLQTIPAGAEVTLDCEPYPRLTPVDYPLRGYGEIPSTIEKAGRGLPVLLVFAPADEPVDIVVGGQVIARGEVLVLDGRYCVRVTSVARR